MNNVQIIFFLHILREPKYFKNLEKDLFESPYLANLYWLVKDFYVKYNELPIDPHDPNFEQIKEVLNHEKKYYMIHGDMSPEKNLSAFLSNCQTIMSHDYSRFTKSRVDENIQAWINWENFQNRFVDASEYMKTREVTPENVSEVIRQAQNIISGFNLTSDENEMPAKDFFDPDTHDVEIDSSDNIVLGWDGFEQLCNSTSSGVKNKNFILLVGAPNIGKTIFLGNIAVNSCLNGYNTLFVSLEMEESDIAHRMASNVFNMTMDDYTIHKKEMRPIIDDYIKNTANRTKPLGDLWLKRMYSPSPRDLHKAVLEVEQTTGKKIHVLVLDYFTEMGNDEGIKPDNAFNTYKYHKTNAKNIFVNSGIGGYTTFSAHQSSEIEETAKDIFLKDLSESKGILHSPDGILGIVQSISQKTSREYYIKSLKGRHTKFKDCFVRFKIDYEHMRLNCGTLLSNDEYNSIFGEATANGDASIMRSKGNNDK